MTNLSGPLTKVPYTRIVINLENCLYEPQEFAKQLQKELIEKLDPEFKSDIEVYVDAIPHNAKN